MIRSEQDITHFFIRIVPVITVMGTIFFLSHQSGDSLDLPSFPGADKMAHMLAYGALAVTFLWWFGKRGAERPHYVAGLTVLYCFAYGLSDEFHQAFIPLRSVSGWDIIADTAGAALVASVWFYSLRVRKRISVM